MFLLEEHIHSYILEEEKKWFPGKKLKRGLCI